MQDPYLTPRPKPSTPHIKKLITKWPLCRKVEVSCGGAIVNPPFSPAFFFRRGSGGFYHATPYILSQTGLKQPNKRTLRLPNGGPE